MRCFHPGQQLCGTACIAWEQGVGAGVFAEAAALMSCLRGQTCFAEAQTYATRGTSITAGTALQPLPLYLQGQGLLNHSHPMAGTPGWLSIVGHPTAAAASSVQLPGCGPIAWASGVGMAAGGGWGLPTSDTEIWGLTLGRYERSSGTPRMLRNHSRQRGLSDVRRHGGKCSPVFQKLTC